MKFRKEQFRSAKAGPLFKIEQRILDGRALYFAVVDGIAYGGDATRQAAVDRMYRRLAFNMVSG